MKHLPTWPLAMVGLVAPGLLVSGLVGCNGGARGDRVNGASASPQLEPPVMVPMQAEAELIAARGTRVEGHARFFQQPAGVRVVLEVADAEPGKKGVHVHTHGDCSNMQNESMGPHLAPTLEQHALPSEAVPRHLGDLGNITIAGDGKGRLELDVPAATLGGDASTSFLGRALIVDSAEDTGSGAQPAGNAGAPLACGVIHERGS
jgi:superoxide dismutase, Cu-Zn family